MRKGCSVPSEPKPRFRRVRAAVLVAALLYPFADPALARYAPPAVDLVVVDKGERVLRLLVGGRVLLSYPIALGRNPAGHKERAGDCRTPEGRYVLDRRNARSKFYKSIHISYPNSRDLAEARRRGVSPGADIMIHGLPRGFEDLADCHFARNWTKGCIAVNNAQMDEIWRLVPDGTPIVINP